MAPLGLATSTGDVSVKPYPSQIGHPVTFCHNRITSSVTAVPPAADVFKAEKSNLVNSLSRAKALYSVLTATKAEIWRPFMVFTKAGISRGLGINMLCAP